ncbi:MAG: hypothetical protein ACJ75J_08575 [Cytophagaceae bacterium]
MKPSLEKRQKRRDKRLGEEVIECYRRGSRVRKPPRYKKYIQKLGVENAPQKEGIDFVHKIASHQKDFNDDLQPLIRFIRSRVGKPWDKTYSELCSRMDKRSVSGLHVFNHIFDFVYLHVELKDKKVWHLWGRQQLELTSHERWPRFYVHPRTGILLKAKTYPKARVQNSMMDFVEVDALRRCYKLNGIWYEIAFEEVQETIRKNIQPDGRYQVTFESNIEPRLYHQFFPESGMPSSYDCILKFGRAIFPKSKRQLNSREIRRMEERK